MLYQTGFRPSGVVLGQISISPAFPTFIQSFPAPVAPVVPETVYTYPIVTPEVVPTPTPSYGPSLATLAVGGLAIAGIAVLLASVAGGRR